MLVSADGMKFRFEARIFSALPNRRAWLSRSILSGELSLWGTFFAEVQGTRMLPGLRRSGFS
jgi:hypothetical protein